MKTFLLEMLKKMQGKKNQPFSLKFIWSQNSQQTISFNLGKKSHEDVIEPLHQKCKIHK